jgi:ATP-binding cassette subfamily C protein
LLLSQPHATDKELINALKQAEAYHYVSQLPKGLDTTIGDRGVKLSGGERQRLAIARALLKKPSLLLLDEATSNLDTENEKRIIKTIDNLHGQITMLIIAHRLSTIKKADKIYIIDQGEIKTSGTWKQLKNHNEHFYA